MLKDLILRNRSYRRFDESYSVDRQMLLDLIDLARLSASGGNAQPLKYIIACNTERNAAVFPHLAWAGFLKDWDGPVEGERPSAYVVILCDTSVTASAGVDHGIAAQSILLGAAEQGLGGCMIGSIERDGLRKALDIDQRYEILLVIALGKPAETVQLETVGPNGDIKYWRDSGGVHHVPKRRPDEIVLD
jgi:nitroreductase